MRWWHIPIPGVLTFNYCCSIYHPAVNGHTGQSGGIEKIVQSLFSKALPVRWSWGHPVVMNISLTIHGMWTLYALDGQECHRRGIRRPGLLLDFRLGCHHLLASLWTSCTLGPSRGRWGPWSDDSRTLDSFRILWWESRDLSSGQKGQSRRVASSWMGRGDS